MNDKPESKTWHDNLPFPRHWFGYLAIKILVLGIAALMGLKWWGVI